MQPCDISPSKLECHLVLSLYRPCLGNHIGKIDAGSSFSYKLLFHSRLPVGTLAPSSILTFFQNFPCALGVVVPWLLFRCCDQIPWQNQLIKQNDYLVYGFRELESMMAEQKQMRVCILISNHDTERWLTGNHISHLNLKSYHQWQLSSSITPPHLRMHTKQLHQLGNNNLNTWAYGRSFSFKKLHSIHWF